MRSLLLAALLITGCDDASAPTDAGDGADTGTPPASGPVALLDVPADGAIPFRGAPFPSDLFTGADGTIDLGTPPQRGMLWESVQNQMNERRGYCRICTVHFPLSGDLDPATVPSRADVGALGAASDAIVMMRADASGGFLPVDAEFQPLVDALSVRAGGRITLLPRAQYIVALTDQLRGPGGEPLAASPLFIGVRDGTGSGPEHERAATVLAPALDALASAGVPRDSIVAVAAFTTQDTGEHLREMRAIVDAAPAPVATLDRVYRRSDGTLDALLGTPAENLPGSDVPAAPGTDGETAVAHEHIEMILTGSFEAPRIIEGSGADVGFLRRDAAGAIAAGPQEAVPFALIIPVGVDLTSVPVLYAHHGLGGTRGMAVQLADGVAALGMATLGIDSHQHGLRASDSFDTRHNFRGGDLGPDGFAEHSAGEVSFRLQGISGAEAGLALHPGYVEAGTLQIVSDVMSTTRFMHVGDLTTLQGADPALAGLAFDTDHTFFLGVSNGGLTGISALAAYPGIEAALFSVAPAGILDTVCHAPAFASVRGSVLTIYQIRAEFDGVSQRACMHPLIAFVGHFAQNISPAATVHYLFDEPLHDQTPDVLFQHAVLDEVIGTANTEALQLAANVPVDGASDFAFSNVQTGAAPFRANRSTPNGEVTAGGWYFADASHGMLLVRNAQSEYEAPYRYPFTERAAPLSLSNPVDAAQAQMAAFFSSRLSDGRATIEPVP